MCLGESSELVGLLKRLVFQNPVEIRLFNSEQHFQPRWYKSLSDLVAQSCEYFKIDPERLQRPRFYAFPFSGAGSSAASALQSVRKITTELEWQAFVSQWESERHSGIIVVHFVTGPLSPPLSLSSSQPITPPIVDLHTSEEAKSEPQSSHGLTARDGGMCIICGYSDHVEVAHVIDEHRAELLEGSPNAPAINDLRNLILLCPNHHTAFDRYEWTLIEQKRRQENGQEITGLVVRSTPVRPQPSQDMVIHVLQTFIRFEDSSKSPHMHLFLLKQLGRFDVPCRVCGTLFPPKSLYGHYRGTHKSKKQKAKWEKKPFLLPKPCNCPDRGTNPWELLQHLIKGHADLLYA